MMRSFYRRAVLIPVLVLLVAAWVLAADPLMGWGAPEAFDPETVEELLERTEEVEQELFSGLLVEIGPGSQENLLQRQPGRRGEAQADGRRRPQENLLGHCSVSRAPPRK